MNNTNTIKRNANIYLLKTKCSKVALQSVISDYCTTKDPKIVVPNSNNNSSKIGCLPRNSSKTDLFLIAAFLKLITLLLSRLTVIKWDYNFFISNRVISNQSSERNLFSNFSAKSSSVSIEDPKIAVSNSTNNSSKNGCLPQNSSKTDSFLMLHLRN